jgi:hypothetical protein
MAPGRGKEIPIGLDSKGVEDTRQKVFEISGKTMGSKRRDMNGQEKAEESENQKYQN